MNIILLHLSSLGIISRSVAIDDYSETDFHKLIDSEANWEITKKINIVVLCRTRCSQFVKAVRMNNHNKLFFIYYLVSI